MKRIGEILIVFAFMCVLCGSTPVDFSFQQLSVVYREQGCSYFLAWGSDGYFRLFEWRDGYDPQPGDMMLGELQPAGYADIYYPFSDRKGAVRLVNIYESRGKAIQRYYDYCGNDY